MAGKFKYRTKISNMRGTTDRMQHRMNSEIQRVLKRCRAAEFIANDEGIFVYSSRRLNKYEIGYIRGYYYALGDANYDVE